MDYDHLLSFLHTFVAIPCYTSVNVIVILWYSVPIIDRIDKLVDFMGFRPVWRPPLFWGVDPRFSKGSVSYVKLIQKKSEICQSQKNWDHFPKKSIKHSHIFREFPNRKIHLHHLLSGPWPFFRSLGGREAPLQDGGGWRFVGTFRGPGDGGWREGRVPPGLRGVPGGVCWWWMDHHGDSNPIHQWC